MLTRELEINAPIERVFEVVSHFSEYPDFLEGTVSAKERKNSKGHFVDFKVNVIKEIEYTLKIQSSPPSELSWTFVEGDMMKKNSGSWKLESLGKDKTKATYSIDIGFGWMVPKMIVDQLTSSQLPEMLAAFKKRAEQG